MYWSIMSSARAMSLLEKSDPIQLCPIIDDGTLITRLILGENVHMLFSSVSVPLPRSFFGSMIRTSDFSSPLVHACMVIERSQSGRWMTMVISVYDDRPRQWSIASRTICVASRSESAADTAGKARSNNGSEKRLFIPSLTIGSGRRSVFHIRTCRACGSGLGNSMMRPNSLRKKKYKLTVLISLSCHYWL